MKNVAKPMASIIKNYTAHEQITVNTSYSLRNIEMLRKIAIYQPAEHQVCQNITAYLHALHVDYEEDGTPTLYDVPSCNMMEFRGDATKKTLSKNELNYLFVKAMEDVDSHSLLALLYKEYLLFCRKHPRMYLRNITGYLNSVFSDVVKLRRVQTIIDTHGPNRRPHARDPEDLFDYESHRPTLNKDFEYLQTILPMGDSMEIE